MKEGIRIGEWELVRQLNSGGMGQVWQVRKMFAMGVARVAAMKLLLPSGVLDQRSREGLFAEASILMRFQHDHIPKVVDMGEHEGMPYVVMDLISGRDLSQFLAELRKRGTALDPKVAAHIARCVAYALHYAHTFEIDGVRHEVIHRDVASKNVMISGRGGVFVLDFGIAESRSHQTSGNTVKGTLLYMAPEHIKGFASPASDAFGLGTILWEMLENRVFRGDVPSDLLRAKVNDGWVPPLTRPGIPEELRFIVEGLLRADPRERMTLAEAIDHLESPEFPAQRTPLSREMRICFGVSVMGSGQTQHDFVFSDLLDKTIAAGKVAQQSPPLAGLNKTTWSRDAFDRAGAPAVIATSDTRPLAPRALEDVHDDGKGPDLAPPSERASEPAADGVERPRPPTEKLGGDFVARQGDQRAEDVVSQPAEQHGASESAESPERQPTVIERRRDTAVRSPIEPPPHVTAVITQLSPMAPGVAAVITERLPPPTDPSAPIRRDFGRTVPASEAQTQPQVAWQAPVAAELVVPRPYRPPSRGRLGPVAFLGVLAIAMLAVGTWALGLRGTDRANADATPHASANLEPHAEVRVDEHSADSDPPPSAPTADDVIVADGRSPTSAPAPVVDLPAQSDASEGEETGTDRTEADTQRDSESTDPAEPQATPEQPPAGEEPATTSPPAPTKPSPPVVRSKVFVAIGFVDAMDISIGSARRTLRMTGPDRVTLEVRPGRRTVRWGPPGQPLRQSKTVTIASGTDYTVQLGSNGPSFDPVKKKP